MPIQVLEMPAHVLNGAHSGPGVAYLDPTGARSRLKVVYSGLLGASLRS